MDEIKNKDDLPNNATVEKKPPTDNLQRLQKEQQSNLDRLREFIIKTETRHIELTNENTKLKETITKLSDELETAKRLLEQK